MRNRKGILLLTSFALLGALAIRAAPPQRGQPQGQQEGQSDGKSMNRGIPWAYGFATPFLAAPAPGTGGGAGGRGGAAAAAAPAPPAPAPAAELEDRDAPRHLPGAAAAFALGKHDFHAKPRQQVNRRAINVRS